MKQDHYKRTMKSIISLSIIPSRVKLCKETIDSLKLQGLDIYAYIPKELKRNGSKFDGKIPDFFDGVNVKIVEDLGSLSKLWYALDEDTDLIITADDDIIYNTGWARRLIRAYERDSMNVYAYKGRIFDQTRTYKRTKEIVNPPNITSVDIVTGVRGCLYHKKMFENITPKHDVNSPLWFNDDIFISGELAKKNIKRMVIPGMKSQDSDTRWVDRLALGNKQNRWERTNKAINLYNNWW